MLTFAIILVVITVLFSLFSKKQESSAKKPIIKNKIKIESDSDVAMQEMEQLHSKIKDLANEVLEYPQNNELYSWESISNNILVSPESVCFDFEQCPKCNSPLVKILYNHYRGNMDVLICQNCKSQFDTNKGELLKVEDVEIQKEPENTIIDVVIDCYETLPSDVKSYLNENYPNTCEIINILIELKCVVRLYIDNENDYILVEYRNKSFLIWLDKITIIHYPYWYFIEKSKFTEQVITTIHNHNYNFSSCVYWLGDNFCSVNSSYSLSSNLDLYNTFNCKQIDANLMRNGMDYLIDSSNVLIEKLQTESKQNNNNRLDSPLLKDLMSVLEKCEYNEVTQDDEGDIHFVVNNKRMFAKAIGNINHIRIFYPCMHLDGSKNVGQEDYDSMALNIQIFNMLPIPIKCCFYKTRESFYSLTTYININTTFTQDAESVGTIISRFIEFIETDFIPLVFVENEVIDFVNSYHIYAALSNRTIENNK